MSISRSWTPIEGDPRWESESYYDEAKAKLDGLMLWWSQLHDEAERDVWARQRAFDEGCYEPEPIMRRDYPRGPEGDAEYEADCAAEDAGLKVHADARKARDEMARSQIDFIEAQLAEAGARPMRPYEHWNEDEAYMAYMERDR